MQVLMFGWEFPPRISGGLGTACFGITQALVGLGHEVIFVMPCREDEFRPGGDDPGEVSGEPLSKTPDDEILPRQRLTLHVVQSGLRPYADDRHYRDVTSATIGLGIPHLRDLYGPGLISEARRYGKAAGLTVRKHRFDVIHAHDWMTVFAGIEAKAISGRPLLLHIHSLEFDRSGENINRDIYDIERCGMEAADGVIAVSHYTRRTIINRYGVDPAKVFVVHNAVIKNNALPGGSSRRDPTRQVVLFLGRITFQKGPDYFIKAASRVLRELPDVIFVMAGDGDMSAQMLERVTELGIGGNFHFTGFLTGKEVDRIYADSDLFVMPSVSEPFGIAPLEAMCHGVPVIISKQSGVSEILHHVLKVDFWDVSDMADKMIAVLRRPALKADMVNGSREELQEVCWESAAVKILNVYRLLLPLAPEMD